MIVLCAFHAPIFYIDIEIIVSSEKHLLSQHYFDSNDLIRSDPIVVVCCIVFQIIVKRLCRCCVRFSNS